MSKKVTFSIPLIIEDPRFYILPVAYRLPLVVIVEREAFASGKAFESVVQQQR